MFIPFNVIKDLFKPFNWVIMMDTTSLNMTEISTLETLSREGKKPVYLFARPSDEKVQEVVNVILKNITKTQLEALEPWRRIYYLKNFTLHYRLKQALNV